LLEVVNFTGYRLIRRTLRIGCSVIQDFDLWKLDDLRSHIVDTKWFKITKNRKSLKTFSLRTETLCHCYTLLKVPWYVPYDISIARQWAPGPLHSKGKIWVFLLQEVLFIQWEWANMDIKLYHLSIRSVLMWAHFPS